VATSLQWWPVNSVPWVAVVQRINSVDVVLSFAPFIGTFRLVIPVHFYTSAILMSVVKPNPKLCPVLFMSNEIFSSEYLDKWPILLSKN